MVGPYALQYTLGLPAPLIPPLILVYILCSAASLPKSGLASRAACARCPRGVWRSCATRSSSCRH